MAKLCSLVVQEGFVSASELADPYEFPNRTPLENAVYVKIDQDYSDIGNRITGIEKDNTVGKLIKPSEAIDDLFKLSGMGSNDEENVGEFEANINGEDVNKNDNYYQPYSFDQIEEHIGDITSLENRIQDLIYLHDDIKKSKGMNQSFALEAEKLLPGFGGVPIGFYSKDLSATRYKAALEEITGGMWALIAAAAMALAAMIAKFIQWVFGGSSSGGSSSDQSLSDIGDDINHNVEKMKEQNEIVKEIDVVLKASDPIPHNVEIVQTNVSEETKELLRRHPTAHFGIDDLIEEYVIKGGENSYLAKVVGGSAVDNNIDRKLINDILTQGHYLKLMIAAKQNSNRIKTDISKLIFDIKKARDDAEVFIANKKTFKSNKNLRDIKPLIVNVDSISRITLSNFLSDVDRARNIATNKEVMAKISYNSIYRLFTTSINAANIDNMIKETNDFASSFSELEEVLDKVKNSLTYLQDTADDDSEMKFYIHQLKNVIKTATDYMVLVGKYIREIKNFMLLLKRISTDLFDNICKETLKVLKTEEKVRKAIGEELNSELKSLMKKLIEAESIPR